MTDSKYRESVLYRVKERGRERAVGPEKGGARGGDRKEGSRGRQPQTVLWLWTS